MSTSFVARGRWASQLQRSARWPTDQPVGPRLASLLETARNRAQTRIAELQQILNRIQDFEQTHRAELCGQVEFDTGNPRTG